MLGEGGMGAVYRARHVRTGRRYAVKVMPQASQLDPDLVRRFRREAELLASLGHAGLVAVHDFDVDDDGTAYMVMDCLAGEDVAARLERQGALHPRQALKIARQVASALEAAHAAGVLHRDLKPANIFLQTQAGAEERAVLLDFGIAKIMEDGDATRLTHTGATIGTPGYMSPEQARAEELDVRSDVYSLGCVIYEMLCGVPPFDGPTVTAILVKVLTEEPARPSSVELNLPSVVDDVLSKALAKSREERYLTPTALVRDLEAIWPHEGGGVRAPTQPAPANTALSDGGASQAGVSLVGAPSSEKKRPVLLLVAGAFLGALGLVAIAGAAVWWAQRGDSDDVMAQGGDDIVDPRPVDDGPPTLDVSTTAPIVAMADAAVFAPDAAKPTNAKQDKPSRRPHRPNRLRPKADPTPTPGLTTPTSTPTPSNPSMAGHIQTMKKYLAGYEALQGILAEYRRALSSSGARTPAICKGGLSSKLMNRAKGLDAPGAAQSVGSIHNQVDDICAIYEKIDDPPPEAEIRFKKARSELAEAARAVASARPGEGIDAADLSKLKRTISGATSEMQPEKRFPCGSSNFRVIEAFVQVIEDRDLKYAIRDAHYAHRDACNSLGWAGAEPRRKALVQTVDTMQSSYRQAAQSYRDSIRNMGG